MLNDLLDETKGFKYPGTVKILLKKYKDTETEFSPVYFTSTTKTVINNKFDLDKFFQEMILIIKELNFLCRRKRLIKLKRKTIFASMFFVIKMN